MIDRVFQATFDALTKALIKGGHLAGFSLEERDEITAALVDAISPALHKDLHERLDRQARAIEWIRTIAGGGDRLPSEWADPWRKRAEDAEATVARVKALAEDMRTWCSPHGIAVTYAQRIDEAIDPPEPVGIEADSEAEFAAKLGAIMRKHRAEVHPEHDDACGTCAVIKGAPEVLTAGLDDLPAVREFVAEFDPREESTEIYAVKSGYVVADDGGWVPGTYPTKQAAERAARNMRDHGTPDAQAEELPCPTT